MQTLTSPCSTQVRLSKTFAGIPPVRQTSAGHGTWQTGHRDLVRLSNSSVSFKTGSKVWVDIFQLKCSWKPLARQPKQLMPMQTTIMIKANNMPKIILNGFVFPSCRPNITPQTIPATPPPKKAMPGEALPFFAPNRTTRMVNKTGASSTEKKSTQFVFTGGDRCWTESTPDAGRSRPQNGHQAAA